MKNKEIDLSITDAIMERPSMFKVGDTYYYIYPMTLGKMMLTQRIIEEIGIDRNVGGDIKSIFLLVREHRESLCELISYMTARNEYYDVFDKQAFDRRKETFSSIPDEDLTSILVLVLSSDKTELIMKHLGINEEQKNMQKVMKVKEGSDKNSYTFGGVSIYGSLIDVAMERYKMSKRQVVWEIDYQSLRLLLADRVNNIYVTDEERRRIHIPKDRTKIDGDDKEELMRVIRSQSWD